MLLDAALAIDGPAGEPGRTEAARLIGSLPDRFDRQLHRLLQDPAPEVVRAAMRAAAALGHMAAIPVVVGRLSDAAVSTDAADALVAYGNSSVPALQDFLASEDTAAETRLAIPDVLQRLGTEAAEHALVEHLLTADPILRLQVIAALNKLRQHNPERRLERELVDTLLAAEIFGHYRSYQILGRLRADGAADDAALEQLHESMGREIERIFRLLKLLFPAQDFHSAYVGLRSVNAVVHANALEFLEHSLAAPMRALLLPLIDNEVSVAERIALADRLVGVAAHQPGALAALAAGEHLLQDAARHAERQLDRGAE
jgi:HEAT repeat protein